MSSHLQLTDDLSQSDARIVRTVGRMTVDRLRIDELIPRRLQETVRLPVRQVRCRVRHVVC